MRRRSFIQHAAVVVVAVVLACTIGILEKSGNAHADDTATGTLTGEGSDVMTPIMNSFLQADSAELSPDVPSYTYVGLDQAISDFVGTGPGLFGADFAVSERPLTTDEAAQATKDGRSFAYVPIAASPVALVTLAPNASYGGGTVIEPQDYCQHVQLNLADLDGIYGSPAFENGWGDPHFVCSSSSTSTTSSSTTSTSTTTTTTPTASNLDPLPFSLWENADPTMENEALMSLLDSTQASETSFGNELTTAFNEGHASTESPTASEHWPGLGNEFPNGDEQTVEKIIGLNPRTNAPGTESSEVQLGAILPVVSEWTGAPLGVLWNLPTAAVENDASAYVIPSSAAAAAAEADATLSTNNIVTFNATPTDATAYNNYLMLESYLVVPTTSLPSDRAIALAQLIRFALGTQGQQEITAMGAAPATSAMVNAGLQVAQELDAEAATNASSTSTTSTVDPDCTTTTTSTTSPSTTSTTATTSTTTSTTAPSSTTTSTSPTSTTTSTTTPCPTSTTTTTVPASATTTTTCPSSSIAASSTTTPVTSSSSTSSPTSTTTSSSPSSTTTSSSPSSTTTTSSPSSTTTSSSPTTTTTSSSTTTTTSQSNASDSTTTSSSPTTTTTSSPSSTTTTSNPSSTTTSSSPTSTTTSSSPTTTTTSSPAGTTTTTAPCTTTTTTGTGTNPDSTGGLGGSSTDLAFTGVDPAPVLGFGFLFIIVGELGLRLMRKRLRKV